MLKPSAIIVLFLLSFLCVKSYGNDKKSYLSPTPRIKSTLADLNQFQHDSTNNYFVESTTQNTRGVISVYDHKRGSKEILYTFLGDTFGQEPVGKLIKDDNQILYGLFKSGGAHNRGGIFSFDLRFNQYKVVYSFAEGESIVDAYNSLIFGNDGKLYGLSYNGGAYHLGTLFSFDISNSDYELIKSFDLSTGTGPTAGLVIGEGNKMYGALSNNGPQEKGTLFEFDLKLQEFKMIYAFKPEEIYNPRSEIVATGDGNIYGLANSGRGKFAGGVYVFDISEKSLTSLATFDTLGLSWVDYSFSAINDSVFIGSTLQGGINGQGAYFIINTHEVRVLKEEELQGLIPFILQSGDTSLIKDSRFKVGLREAELVSPPTKVKE